MSEPSFSLTIQNPRYTSIVETEFLAKMSSPYRKTTTTLQQIFQDIPIKLLAGEPGPIPIMGIAINSRIINPGELFVAMRGENLDGHDFIPEAIKRGANAIVGDRALDIKSIPYLQVENSRRALSWIAAAFYDHPGRKLTVIGVTGTDGKTTTCNLIFQILKIAGLRTGIISTINADIGDETIDTGFHVTTPDAHDLQRYLARMVDAGLTHVILETTSHGWNQARTDACEFDIGVLTNITHEHLDQHRTFEEYRAAKGRLFESLEWTAIKPQGNPRLAVLNKNDPSYSYFTNKIRGLQLSYGWENDADIHAVLMKDSSEGIIFQASGKGFSLPVKSRLVGKYNVSNCLAAMAATIIGLGIKPEVAAEGISSLIQIPGRMEQIFLGQPFHAIVDFAHTPYALRVAIQALRNITTNRLIIIFGSAGLRDKEKRILMAETASELADFSIITAEDPRSESLEKILLEMKTGFEKKGGKEGMNYTIIKDRGEAIRFGVKIAHAGDSVVAFGKGHEQSMCFGNIEYPWDDRIAMTAAVSEKLGIPGPLMPKLPSGAE